MNTTTNPYTDEARRSGQWTYVATMPPCDIPGCTTIAGFDAKTKWGPWAFLCLAHYATEAASATLGVGLGQALVLREEVK